MSIHASIHLNTSSWPKGKSSLYIDRFQCWFGHTIERFVACVKNTEHKKKEKKSHTKSESQYWLKLSQLDYFPKSFSPSKKDRKKDSKKQH